MRSFTVDDASCYLIGCTDQLAANYDSWAKVDNGKCDLASVGCTNPKAENYQPDANVDSGLCQISGCMDSLAINYNVEATKAGKLLFSECLTVRDRALLAKAAAACETSSAQWGQAYGKQRALEVMGRMVGGGGNGKALLEKLLMHGIS